MAHPAHAVGVYFFVPVNFSHTTPGSELPEDGLMSLGVVPQDAQYFQQVLLEDSEGDDVARCAPHGIAVLIKHTNFGCSEKSMQGCEFWTSYSTV